MSGLVSEDEKGWLHPEKGEGMTFWQREPPGRQVWRGEGGRPSGGSEVAPGGQKAESVCREGGWGEAEGATGSR